MYVVKPASFVANDKKVCMFLYHQLTESIRFICCVVAAITRARLVDVRQPQPGHRVPTWQAGGGVCEPVGEDKPRDPAVALA